MGDAKMCKDTQGRMQRQAMTGTDRRKDAQGHARTSRTDMQGRNVLARPCEARTSLCPR